MQVTDLWVEQVEVALAEAPDLGVALVLDDIPE